MKKNKLNYLIRDWAIIVLVFAIGLVLLSLFFWQIYLSDKIGGGYLNINSEPTNISVKMVDKVKLQADLVLMEEKEKVFLQIIDSPSKLIDPAK